MENAKVSVILLAMLMMASVLAALPPAAASPAAGGGFSPMDDRPECNFTWLRADGVGTIGSTAMYIHDGSLDIFIEAFPASGANWDPKTITDCDIIIAEDHGHGTHYDAATVAAVQKNTGAYVVGNTAVANAMRSRGVPTNRIVELSPTLGGTDSVSDVAGCNITAIGMTHTMATTVQVDTFYVELPSGIKFFHGACAASENYASYIKNRALLDNLDMMALDFEHDFDKVWDEKEPNLLFKTHTFSAAGEGYYWDEDPSTTGATRVDHNQTYRYQTPLPNAAPVLSLGQASPRDVTEDDEVTFKVFFADVNDDAPASSSVFIRDDQGSTVERGLTTVPSGSSWIDGKFLQYKGKLSPGKYTFRFAAHDGEFAATGDVDWHSETVNVTPRNQVPQLSKPGLGPREGDTDTVFRYDVLYRDGDDQEPASAQIFVDGTPYPMDTEVTSGPWTDWVTFHYETTMEVGDNHRYYFLFTDGEDQVRLPLASASPNWLSGPVVEPPNYEPVLTSQRFTPLSGDRDTEFTFYVTYTDGENDRPVTSFLFLDGTPYVMNPDGNDYVSGVTFSYKTRLDVGPHDFHFTFSDGEHTVRLPESGELDGPDVSNREPTAVISSPSDGTRFEPDDYVSFESTGSDDPDGDPLEYTWTSDLDGVLGTGQTVVVQLSEGQHMVTLSVSDPFGGTHEGTVTVLVKPYLPHLFIVAIETNVDRPVEGDLVRITATISNDGEAKAQGATVTISVDGVELVLDTLSVDIDAVRTSSATWTAVLGTHTTVVEVGDDTDSIDIEVAANDPPVTTMELVNSDPKLKPGQEVYFKATVTDANGDPVAYAWDFGDGHTATQEGPSHVYERAGTYTVTLTVTDTRGGETVETLTVEIVKPKAEDESPGPGAVMAMAAMAAALTALAWRSKDE